MVQKNKKVMGRPKKYGPKIRNEIIPEELYSPAMLTDLYIEIMGSQANRRNIRHAFTALKRNHKFPDEGDGFINYKGYRY